MKHEFKVEFWDGIVLIIIGTSCQHVIEQVNTRMFYMRDLAEQVVDWKIRNITYLRECK